MMQGVSIKQLLMQCSTDATRLNHKHDMKLKEERWSLAAYFAYAYDYPTTHTY